MTSAEDIRLADMVEGKVDQVVAVDFLAGPRTVTIKSVSKGPDTKQPINFYLEEFDRPFRPCLTMRRLMLTAWGNLKSDEYVGRKMTLYNDPTVTFGPNETGGVRISHLSHIKTRVSKSFPSKQGQTKKFSAEPLPDTPAPTPGNGITAKMILAAGFENDENGRADWLAFISSTIGRQVNSTKELTTEEAANVVSALEGSK